MNKQNADKMAENLKAIFPDAIINVQEQSSWRSSGRTSFYVYISSSLIDGMHTIYSQDELDDLKNEFPQIAAMETLVTQVRKLADKLCSGKQYDASGAANILSSVLEQVNNSKKLPCPGTDRRACTDTRFVDQEICSKCEVVENEHRAKSEGRSCASCNAYFYHWRGEGEKPSEDNLPKLCEKCMGKGEVMPEEYWLIRIAGEAAAVTEAE